MRAPLLRLQQSRPTTSVTVKTPGELYANLFKAITLCIIINKIESTSYSDLSFSVIINNEGLLFSLCFLCWCLKAKILHYHNTAVNTINVLGKLYRGKIQMKMSKGSRLRYNSLIFIFISFLYLTESSIVALVIRISLFYNRVL